MKQYPQKKFQLGRIGIVFVIVLSLFIGMLFGISIEKRVMMDQASQDTANVSYSTPAMLPTRQSATTWSITHTFTGNGNMNTVSFLADTLWKIQWSCGAGTTSENVIINVRDASSNEPVDLAAINTICNTSNVGGETIERHAGNVYLEIESEGGWTVKVLEAQYE